MKILDAKKVLIQRTIALRAERLIGATTPAIKARLDTRTRHRRHQVSEIQASSVVEDKACDELFATFVGDIDRQWSDKLVVSNVRQGSEMTNAVRQLNPQGPCSLTFFRRLRQNSVGGEGVSEAKQHFNSAFDTFDAFQPEKSSWTPTPKLMRTTVAVLACGLALSSSSLFWGMLLVAAVLLYCNDSKLPYFEPTVIDEAFSEQELRNMLTVTPG